MRQLLPSDEDEDYTLLQSPHNQRMVLTFKVIYALHEGSKQLDIRNSIVLERNWQFELCVILIVMTFVDLISKFDMTVLKGDASQTRRILGNGRYTSSGEIDQEICWVEDCVQELYGTEPNVGYLYLKLLKLSLVIHESDPFKDYLRNPMKLYLGERYGDLSRAEIVHFLREAVQHLKRPTSNESFGIFVTPQKVLTFEEAIENAMIVDESDDNDDGSNWSDCSFEESDYFPEFEDFMNASSMDTTDVESQHSIADFEKLKLVFYSDYTFWIQKALEIEVLQSERVRHIDSSFSTMMQYKAKRSKIFQAYQKSLKDKQIKESREFIISRFLIYFEIGKLLALSSTSDRQAIRLIETIVREESAMSRAVEMLSTEAQRFQSQY
jgi:hypothetical protein